MSHDDPSRLRLARHLPADRDRVWQAWTQEWAQWMWPSRFAAEVQLDVRAGAAYRISSEVVGMAVSGEVLEADPPSRLVLTWRWDGEDDETQVTVELHEAPGGTELVLLHERHVRPQQRDDHAQGWQDCLGRLEQHLQP